MQTSEQPADPSPPEPSIKPKEEICACLPQEGIDAPGARGFQRSRDPLQHDAGQSDGQRQIRIPWPAEVGVSENCCLLCGKFGHFYNVCRVYPGQVPWTTPCRSCGVGGHQRITCKAAGNVFQEQQDIQRFQYPQLRSQNQQFRG